VNTDCTGHLAYIEEELQKLQTLKQSYYVKGDGTNQTWITFDHFSSEQIFFGSWDTSENLLEPKNKLS